MNSGRQAFELFQTLDNQQRRFLSEKDYEGTKTLEEWLTFLKGPVEYDILIDRTTQTLKMAIRLLWIFAAFNMVVAIVTQSWFLGVVSVGMAVLAIYQRLKRASYFKRDLHNHLRLFFFPALEQMSSLLGSDTKVSTKFQLREKDQAEHIIEFSFSQPGKSIEIKVPADHYHIEVKTGEGAQQKSGKNLSHKAFIEDLKQSLE